MNLYKPGLAVFSEWLNDIAEVQDDLLVPSNPNADCAKSSYKERAQNTTSDNSKNPRECVLKDSKHQLWKCEKFKKVNVEYSGRKAKDL